ncbi:unnamed protein product [Alternaria alternata]
MTVRSPKINGDRLNSTLQETCTAYGALAAPSTGMCRLTLTPSDKAARDWLVSECKSLGCEVKIDQMGNIFAIRPGTAKDKAPIGMGSHMDTQPAGGRYDGILGVQSALEVLRTLDENNIQTHCPFALINWTNEEGARFPGAMMASGVWSTHSSTDLEACHALHDTSGISMETALRDTGYLGPIPCDYRENRLSAHFELHIEQGPILEKEGKSAFDQVVAEEDNGTKYRVERTWGLPESKFHSNCIEAVRKAAVGQVGEEQVMEMKSRAGHDSAWTSRVCPTSMIFVPSREGISHNPEEYTSPEHCALGAQVLLDAALEYDDMIKSGDVGV